MTNKPAIIPTSVLEMAAAMRNSWCSGAHLAITKGRRTGLTMAMRLAFNTVDLEQEQPNAIQESTGNDGTAEKLP